MRSIGLDYGEKRIGVAVSDPLKKMAFGKGLIENKNNEHVLNELKMIIEKYGDVDEIVVGMPVSMNGKMGIQADKVKKFIDRISTLDKIPVKTYDERLTTVSSTKKLRDAGRDSRSMKAIIDEASAMNMLQDYLDSLK